MKGADLLAMYREIAKSGYQFNGLSVVRYRNEIRDLCRSHNAKSLLDYGSGRGDAYTVPLLIHYGWGTGRPTLYDPAFPPYDVLPARKFDGVICSDVLEHVYAEDVFPLVDSLFGYASKFVWASVCCRSAKKFFPDGTNMHVTVQPLSWWRRRFDKAAAKYPGIDWHLVESP